MTALPLSRSVRRLHRRFRQARVLARALRFPHRPVNAHVIPVRRCNLACAYCNEYDDFSRPVPTADMLDRIDQLARLGTGIVTMSGGEPLLHPDLDAIVAQVRVRDMIATLITNGYFLTTPRIERLNRAGLDHLQISIDNVLPDEVSKKSLKVLDAKLQALAGHAEFDVTVNVVVGAGTCDPDDARLVAGHARALGFAATVGIIHDHSGQLLPLDERRRRTVEEIVSHGGSTFDVASYNRFQRNLARAQPNDWRCRAGARYLYVCEDGLVHWCSQQRGRPGIPLDRYGPDDLDREYRTTKPCAPFCTVGCVHRVAQLDELREDPERALGEWFAPGPDGAAATIPGTVRVLTWMFATGSHRDLFRRAAQRVLRVR